MTPMLLLRLSMRIGFLHVKLLSCKVFFYAKWYAENFIIKHRLFGWGFLACMHFAEGKQADGWSKLETLCYMQQELRRLGLAYACDAKEREIEQAVRYVWRKE